MLEAIVNLESGSSCVPEPIVRCRDCSHYHESMWMTVPEFAPLGTDIEDVSDFWAGGAKVEPDGYCKWAERIVNAC